MIIFSFRTDLSPFDISHVKPYKSSAIVTKDADYKTKTL